MVAPASTCPSLDPVHSGEESVLTFCLGIFRDNELSEFWNSKISYSFSFSLFSFFILSACTPLTDLEGINRILLAGFLQLVVMD